MDNFSIITTQLKALADPVRLKVIDLLSCTELCACSLLEGLSITLPRLSHHMKILIAAQLVTSSKRRTWVYYAINQEQMDKLLSTIDALRKSKMICACYPHMCVCDTNQNHAMQKQQMEIST